MASGSVIGALRVSLGIDSAQFQSGLKRGQSSMAQFAKRAKVAAAVAVTAFAAMAAKMTKSGLSFIDNQAKMARSIDGTIDGLRALQLAGGDAGVSAEAVGAAMQKMGRKLAEAQAEGGPVADALDRIGLSASDLMAMDADERLATIADKAKELGYSAQQTAGILGEFGIRNAEMSLLVAQGGDAIRAAREELVRLGLSMNAVDAAKVEAANDAFSRIGLGVESLSNRLAVAFAPALTAVSNAFVSLMSEGGGLRIVIDALGENIGRVTAYATGFAAVMAGRFALAVGVAAVQAVFALRLSLVALKATLISTGFGALIVLAGELVLRFTRLVSAAGGFGKALGLLKDVAVEVFDRIKIAFGIIPAAVRAGSAQMNAWFIGKLKDMAQSFQDFTWTVAKGLNAIFGSNLTGADGLTDGLGGMEVAALHAAGAARYALDGITSAASAPLKSWQALKGVIAETSAETDGAADSAAALSGEIADIGGGGSGGAAAVGKVTKAVDTLKERMEATKDTMRNAFAGLVTGAKSLKTTLADLLSSFATFSANKLFDNLFSATSSGGGIGGLVSGLLGGIPAYATGTNNHKGGLARINERGGEIVNLPNGSQVIPNDISKRMTSGGGRNTFNIDARGAQEGVADQIAAALKGFGPAVVGQSVDTVKQNLGGWSAQLQRDGALA